MSEHNIHVTPEMSSEDVAHVLDGTCWCQPVVDFENATGDRVYVHRRYLDGPAYQPAESGPAQSGSVRDVQPPSRSRP